jgi:hypothetical protein
MEDSRNSSKILAENPLGKWKTIREIFEKCDVRMGG